MLSDYLTGWRLDRTDNIPHEKNLRDVVKLIHQRRLKINVDTVNIIATTNFNSIICIISLPYTAVHSNSGLAQERGTLQCRPWWYL